MKYLITFSLLFSLYNSNAQDDIECKPSTYINISKNSTLPTEYAKFIQSDKTLDEFKVSLNNNKIELKKNENNTLIEHNGDLFLQESKDKFIRIQCNHIKENTGQFISHNKKQFEHNYLVISNSYNSNKLTVGPLILKFYKADPDRDTIYGPNKSQRNIKTNLLTALKYLPSSVLREFLS